MCVFVCLISGWTNNASNVKWQQKKHFMGLNGPDAAVSKYPGPDAAFFAPFHAKATVDHRVVRMTACIVCTIAIVTAVFTTRYATQWVVSYCCC